MILSDETEKEVVEKSVTRMSFFSALTPSELRWAAGADPGSTNFSISFIDAHWGRAYPYRDNLRLFKDKNGVVRSVRKLTEDANLFVCCQIVEKYGSFLSKCRTFAVEKQRKRVFVLMSANLRALVSMAYPKCLTFEVPPQDWRPAFDLSVTKEEMEDDEPGFRKKGKRTRDKAAYKKRKSKSVAFVESSIVGDGLGEDVVKKDDLYESTLIAVFGFRNASKYVSASSSPDLKFEEKRPSADDVARASESAELSFSNDFCREHGLRTSSSISSSSTMKEKEKDDDDDDIDDIEKVLTTIAKKADVSTTIVPKDVVEKESRIAKRHAAIPRVVEWWMSEGEFTEVGRGKTKRLRLTKKSGADVGVSIIKNRDVTQRERHGRLHPSRAGIVSEKGRRARTFPSISLTFDDVVVVRI